MTNITTLAQLEAIPVDRIVRVDGTDWTRTEKGLMHNDVDLALLYFEGRCLNGSVEDINNAPPARDEWWAGSTRVYYLTRVTDTMVHYISMRNGNVVNWNGSSRRRNWDLSGSIHRLSGAPSEVANSGLEDSVVRCGALFNQGQETQERLNVSEAERVRLAQENLELQQQVQSSARKPEMIRNSINAIRTNLDAIAQLMEE